jgi:hypothetical protein
MANIVANVVDGNNINLTVTPTATQIVTIDRGVAGPPGPSGESSIGGYPVSLSSPKNLDALMFLDSTWTNIPQTEISDGGNF